MQPVVGVVRILLDQFAEQRHALAVLLLLQLALGNAEFPVELVRREQNRLAVGRLGREIFFPDQVAVADEAVDIAVLAAQLERAHEFLLRLRMPVQLDQHHAKVHVGTLKVRELLDRQPVMHHRPGVIGRLHVQVGEREVQRRARLRRDGLDQHGDRLVGIGLYLRDEFVEQLLFIGVDPRLHLGLDPVAGHEFVDELGVFPKLHCPRESGLRLAKRRGQQAKRRQQGWPCPADFVHRLHHCSPK